MRSLFSFFQRVLNWLPKLKQVSLLLEGMDRHFFKPAKSWFSLFCSSVEDEELALGDTGLLTEFPLDKLDDEEEDSFQSVLGFPNKGSFCQTSSFLCSSALGFPILGSLC